MIHDRLVLVAIYWGDDHTKGTGLVDVELSGFNDDKVVTCVGQLGCKFPVKEETRSASTNNDDIRG